MYPNQLPEQQPAQQPPSPYVLPPAQPPLPSGGTSYLDSISAPQNKTTLSPLVLWGLIGAVLVTLAILMVVLLNSGGSSKADLFTQYFQRTDALSTLTSKSSKTIQSSELRALNATTSSVLSTATQESTDVLATVQLKKLPSLSKDSPITAEFSELNTKLDNARLNVTYDRVYAREVGYQLAQIRSQLSGMYKSTKNKRLQAYLSQTDKNLQPLVSQYNEFNDSQG